MELDLQNQLDRADESLRKGNPGEAFSIFKRLLEDNQENETIRYSAALSAAKVGSISAASGYLKHLIEHPCSDSAIYNDALSLLGRIEKDRYSRLTVPGDKMRAAFASAQAYERAYQDSGDYYPGLNAASMYKLAGDMDRSARIVKKVSNGCNKLIHNQQTDDHWLAATMGELALLENNQSRAIHWYSLTRQLIGDAYGEISSMRRQLILLREVIEIDDELFSVLDIPTVVTMTGHMIDTADRQEPRFPQYIEKCVRDEIDKLLSKINAGFGYCSAACGADIIFVEAMLARGAEVHINLPFDQEDFLNVSIRFAGEEWESRYFDVISRCTSVNYSTKEGYLGDDTLFEYNADVITGKTMIRSRQLNVVPEFVAIYDSSLDSISGGSKATALSWQKLGHSVQEIDLRQVLVSEKAPLQKSMGRYKQPEIIKNEINREIHTMLFADFVGFSKMGEAQTPQFFLGLLKEVAKLIESRREGLRFCNTWGGWSVHGI